jgi:uncharacterized protein (TIGR00251 family)
MVYLRENPQGIFFKVYVQPRSSKNMIVGLHGDGLKIKVAAPPVEGAANKALANPSEMLFVAIFMSVFSHSRTRKCLHPFATG